MDQGLQDLCNPQAPPPYSQEQGYSQGFVQQEYPPSQEYGQQLTHYPSSNAPGFPPTTYPSTSFPEEQAPYKYSQRYLPLSSNVASSNQTTDVVSQPGMATGAPQVMVAPPNHMALSIITCFCCCWPVSLFAIIKSNEVDNATRRGDLTAANAASARAKKLNRISMSLGLCFYILLVVLVVMRVAKENAASSNSY
ncbi:proline-rich transmembrane protein 1-like [Rhopilema esculentum]|uniref:proline-rich transmembrane protein 1-like n=1 Tax=Rhopilema esculentum TaxID=499914 RepID=UPI0031D27385